MDERKLPKGRLGRLARLAKVGARSGAELILSKGSASAAQKAADALGTMRGLATKVGQMASYVDGVMPEQHREAYEKWMSGLQSAAPRSAPEAIRQQVEAALGQPLDQLFAEWSDEPMASASIGQVHRAVLPDGRAVAVKVQHPGIGDAMESDLKNAGLIEGALAAVAGTRRFESKRVLEEMRARFREELDYGLEARRQHQFQVLFRGDPKVRIPAVIESHSAKVVLTTELVSGIGLDEARQRPEAERTAWIETLWRFVYKANLVGGLFNADPHPGNYFFQPDGQIAFIDFGCVQPLDEHRKRWAKDIHLASHHRDEAAFAEACRNMLQLQGGDYEPRAIAYVRECFEPVWHRPYRMERAYVGGLVEHMKQLALDFRKGKDDGYVPLPEGLFFLNRLQFGFYSVVARLDAPVDYVAVERAFLGLPPLPVSG
ncbi:MAG: AarF/ABC1/UbiB kinase family protein [Myxococcales bacterium]|nr:AarF/ABC1/UbiB kinase family protein [Myxococcales bacterium]MCB9526284.1 AarF/ABC1/UbiB kinase family protein [Myxococcales bacterium]